MKVFHRDKYEYQGIHQYGPEGNYYYAFRCIKSNFSPEIVLVDSAKLLYDKGDAVYFIPNNLRCLNYASMLSDQSLSCVKLDAKTANNLAVNESKWRQRRRRSIC